VIGALVYLYKHIYRMITLYDLVESRLLSASDHLHFSYKEHQFSCQVDGLGVLYNFQANGKVVFAARLPFDSIGLWADACIQEVAKEYVTRFSSWKRVRHKESGLALNTLRQMHSQFALSKPPVTISSLATLRQYVSVLGNYCEKLEATLEHWERFQLGLAKRPPEAIHCRPSCMPHFLAAQQRFVSDKALVERHFRASEGRGGIAAESCT